MRSYLKNIFFFGFVGSYIGGLLVWFYIGYGCDFKEYCSPPFKIVFLSPLFGFLPFSITSVLFTRSLKKRSKENQTVNIKTQLKLSGYYSFIVMTVISLSLMGSYFLQPQYPHDGSLYVVDGVTYQSVKDTSIDLNYFYLRFLLLPFVGVISSCGCVYLFIKWNKVIWNQK